MPYRVARYQPAPRALGFVFDDPAKPPALWCRTLTKARAFVRRNLMIDDIHFSSRRWYPLVDGLTEAWMDKPRFEGKSGGWAIWEIDAAPE